MQLYPTKPMKGQVNVIGATYRPSYTHFCSGMHDLKKRKHVPAGIQTQDLLNTSQTLLPTESLGLFPEGKILPVDP